MRAFLYLPFQATPDTRKGYPYIFICPATPPSISVATDIVVVEGAALLHVGNP